MFFSPNKEGKLILALEIESSMVRGSVIWIKSGLAPQVIFSEGLAIPWKPNVATSYFIKVSMKMMKQIIDASREQIFRYKSSDKHVGIPHDIEEVHYILSSPWIVSQARTIVVNFDKPTAVSGDRIKKLLDDERAKIHTSDQGAFEPIEEKIFDVRLNGYSVADWKGKECSSLELSYAVTVGSAESMKHLRTLCEHLVRDRNVFFHSSLLLQYVGLRATLPESRDTYALIDVHGELTDVVVVEHGSCVFFGSYPIGIHTIVRKIARLTSTDPKTADSLLSLHLGDRLDESHSKTTAVVMADVAQGWGAEFDKLFKAEGRLSALPHDVIVTAREHEEFFTRSYRSTHAASHIEPLSVDEVTLYADALNRLEK